MVRVPNLLIIIFFLLVLARGKSHAQIDVGIYGGGHAAVYSSVLPDSLNFRRGLGHMFGVTLNFFVTEELVIGVEPGIIRDIVKLQALDLQDREYKDSLTMRTDYLVIPMNLKVISNNRKFRYLAGMELEFPQKVHLVEENEKTLVQDVLKDFNFGASFGVGWRKQMGSHGLDVEFRYTQGILNITDNDNVQPIFSRLKSNSFRLLVKWDFRVKE